MGSSSKGPEMLMPALFTNPSRPRGPTCSLIFAAAAEIEGPSATSTITVANSDEAF